MNSTRKVVKAGILSSRQSFAKTLFIIGSAALVQVSFVERTLAQQLSDGFQFANCPPETRQKPRNCQQVAQIAYALATKKKGYADAGGNGIPDVMERRYVENVNDCSTGNAHAACMFNDPCTAPIGRLMGLRSNSARHATVLFEGTDGNKFECDFTPDTSRSGIPIAHRPDTRIGPAFPDPGESMDPAYDCLMNGANTRPLNAFGGGGGALQSSIMALLMQMLQQQLAKQTPAPSPAADVPSIQTPTPTPTPASAMKDSADGESSRASLDEMDLSENNELLGEESSARDTAMEEDDDENEEQDPGVSDSPAKSVRSVWDRTDRDVF
jgi:hypothetical protein